MNEQTSRIPHIIHKPRRMNCRLGASSSFLTPFLTSSGSVIYFVILELTIQNYKTVIYRHQLIPSTDHFLQVITSDSVNSYRRLALRIVGFVDIRINMPLRLCLCQRQLYLRHSPTRSTRSSPAQLTSTPQQLSSTQHFSTARPLSKPRGKNKEKMQSARTKAKEQRKKYPEFRAYDLADAEQFSLCDAMR